ncbi:asparagine synthase (glutamine-hydrolyzing) [Edaphobacter sp. HDX4]|uniref:asparagine synthase (glutamine-hydrolyzing) n=1 Tax=Edaphobacter sp. HDX4 TaxID=2794064 RepID=UPI002FE6B397
MCGIAGIFSSRSNSVDLRESLTAITHKMATRGPDAMGQWISSQEKVGLGHRRLSIIDLDTRSDQPMHSADQRYTVVFNGEIYNYRELRRELEGKGCQFVTTGDTEVLLQMYAEYGAAMLHRLRGMYAFGIWDEKAQELFLARDPFGIKPLYYAEGNGCLYFASQVKALLDAPGIDLREQSAAHVGFFVWGSVPEPFTLYRGIHCLPSGTWLCAGRDGISGPRRFSSPVEAFTQFHPSELPKSEAERDSRLHDALKESVQMHEIADVPVAVFLSAGLDSGVIASLASENGRHVEALTLGFDLLRGTDHDETSLAARVAREYALPHSTRFIDQATFVEHRERLLQQMDQPTIDGVNAYFISWLAREYGFKVAISGLGGDEIFGGYPSFRQIPPTVYAVSAVNSVPVVAHAWHRVTAPLMQRFTSPKYASLFEYGGSWGGAYLLRRGLFMPWELPQFLDPEMVRTGWRELGSIEKMNALVQPLGDLQGTSREQANFLRVSALEMSFYMRTQLLRDADWAGMAHSLEIRVPFVDMALLQKLAPLRASLLSPRKSTMAKVLQKPLPAEILNRPKSGFRVPVREWMQETPERGLRHWAKYVYGKLWTGTCPAVRESFISDEPSHAA